MGVMPKDWYRQQAQAQFHRPSRNDLSKLASEVDEHAEVSSGTLPGGWVQAWIWVPDPVPADKQQEKPHEKPGQHPGGSGDRAPSG